jgi:hypothetical protein
MIIDKEIVKTVRWEDNPDTYDQRLCNLGRHYEECIIINPDFDSWILDCFDHSIRSDKCIMWVRGDKWLAKKFNSNWSPSKGWKIIEVKFDSVKTNKVIIEKNPDLPDMFDEPDYQISIDDLETEHIWYLDRKYYSLDNVWVYKMRFCERPFLSKNMGTIQPNITDRLDVVFISYDEANADENWNKVLEVCPYAHRIHGVKGIFEAHKAAAELVSTDMFWVVDGDAEILPSWRFSFQPNIFNRDCIHVWNSINPINNLIYGYGGVKLFPKKLLLDAASWKIDMTTSIGNKLKVINEVSNITSFNTDPFSSWRSSFRECVKLSLSVINYQDAESSSRLKIWKEIGKDKKFGEYAIKGAIAGEKFAKENAHSQQILKLINDRQWLYERFTEEEKSV